MKTIYVVTDGEYSDYHICGVFDNNDLANKFCDKFGGGIEEWDLNPYTVELQNGYSAFCIHMNKEGKVLTTREINMGCEANLDEHFIAAGRILVSFCFARNEDHAIKITNERRTSILALDRWK